MTKITRRKSRENAIILLYQGDLLEKDIKEIIKNEKELGRPIDDFTSE
jgi:hypothetical protein